MAIKDWPEGERPREKLLQLGAQALSDAELLAIFLRTGVTGYSAVDLARTLLQDFGGLRPLLDASEADFCAGKGLGSAKYAQLQAVLEMSRRHFEQTLQNRCALNNPDDTRQYLLQQLRDHRSEVFGALLLDSQNRVIRYDNLFFGGLNSTAVYPREVVKHVLKHNAASVIFAHNHPSGVAEPSQADIQITQQLQQALRTIDVRVLDHMIVGDGRVESLAERGLI
jgi:DNA repair protein RadC